jgi:arsenate reductase
VTLPVVRIVQAIALTTALTIGAIAQGADGPKPGEASAPLARGPEILMVCEHGSVKSLMAASLFNQAAIERHLPYRAIARGVTPDASVPPPIASALEREGFDVEGFTPTRVAATDLARASRVVAIGVDLKAFNPASASIEAWNDVPAASADYGAARASLKRHVEALINDLQARSRSPN